MTTSENVNVSSTSRGSEFRRATMHKAGTTDEWWQQRAPFIGASASAALFDQHPFLTLGALAREKREGVKQSDNAAMMRGRFLEDGVARWWAHVNEVEVREVDELYTCNEVLVATLDRVVVGEPIIVEVKTTSVRVHEVERYWWWQAQAQLACTGFDRIEFAVLDGTLRLQSFTVLPEPTAMANIVEAAGMFLAAVKDPANDFDDVTFNAPESIELTEPAAREALRWWRNFQRQRDELDAEIGKLKGIIDRALGPCGAGTINGHEVVRRMHRTVRNMIDPQRLRADHPDIAREYTKEPVTSTWLVLR